MKELTKKILEAGLVDKHTAYALEKWGNLDRGASDLVGTNLLNVTEATLRAFADDISTLLEAEIPLRETVLDFNIENLKKDGYEEVIVTVSGSKPFLAYRDQMGKLIVEPHAHLILGDLIGVRPAGMELSPGELYRVTVIEAIFTNVKVTARRITVVTP